MISVIIPTLGTRETELTRLFNSLRNQTNQDFEVVLVSQQNHEKVAELIAQSGLTIKHIKIDKMGLSHSRNIGLKYVTGDIITFSDDDCWYNRTAFQEVSESFTNTNDAIVCFQIYDPDIDEYYKNYSNQPKDRLSFKEIFRKSSIEIFLNLKKVDKKHVSFDENFGLGAKYPSGEENIFLAQLHRLGYKIAYIPKVVVYHKKPTIQSRLTFKAFMSKGPLFKEIFNTPIGLFLLTSLFVKKFRNLERPFYLYTSAIKELFSYKKN